MCILVFGNNMEGWIKYYRKLIDNPISSNMEIMWFFSYCLLKANHKKAEILIWYEKVTINPGQFVSSVSKLSEHFWVGRSKIYRLIKYLEKDQFMKHEWNTKYSLFTIVNRSKYQDVKHQWNTTETQTDTNNNDNNDKETSTIVEATPPEYVPQKITLDIDEVEKSLREISKAAGFSRKADRRFSKHILSKKFCKIAQEHDCENGLKFAQAVLIASLQEWNFWRGKISSSVDIYKKYSKVINEYKTLKEKSQSWAGSDYSDLTS